MEYNEWNNFFGKYFNEYRNNFLDIDTKEYEKVIEKILDKNDNYQTDIEYLNDIYKKINDIGNPIIIDINQDCNWINVYYSNRTETIRCPENFIYPEITEEIIKHYKEDKDNRIFENNSRRAIIINPNNIDDEFGARISTKFKETSRNTIYQKIVLDDDLYFSLPDNKWLLDVLLEKSETFKKRYLSNIKMLKDRYSSYLNSIKQSDENELYMELLEDD